MAEDIDRARMVGINHVALTVGDADEARAFYESIFAFPVRGETDSAVFLDMGDQFLALSEADDAGESSDAHRHFGVVVDDTDLVADRLAEESVELLEGPGLDFRDPWGNRIQVVAYEDVQFTKTDHVLAGMDLSGLEKTDDAVAELAEKGMAPE
ncbi:VOC family protein [Halosimplex salinum]|uniref:VOC family protein n=1 Tax=Halosimplex salinum TaxID=1710538 RepID=UPI000F4730CD|nr:VOC family protein [Halosimplex salinum]